MKRYDKLFGISCQARLGDPANSTLPPENTTTKSPKIKTYEKNRCQRGVKNVQFIFLLIVCMIPFFIEN